MSGTTVRLTPGVPAVHTDVEVEGDIGGTVASRSTASTSADLVVGNELSVQHTGTSLRAELDPARVGDHWVVSEIPVDEARALLARVKNGGQSTASVEGGWMASRDYQLTANARVKGSFVLKGQAVAAIGSGPGDEFVDAPPARASEPAAPVQEELRSEPVSSPVEQVRAEEARDPSGPAQEEAKKPFLGGLFGTRAPKGKHGKHAAGR